MTEIINTCIEQLDSADISFPLGTKVLIAPKGKGRRFKGEFVGQKGNSALLLHPFSNEFDTICPAGTIIQVQYLHGGAMLTVFNSKGLAVQTKPSPLLYVQMPKTVARRNPRKHERYQCVMPITVCYSGCARPGIMINISRSGCRVAFEPAPVSVFPLFDASEEVFCQFQIPGSDEPAWFSAQIRNISPFRNKESLGLSFEGLTEDNILGVESFLTILQEYGP